jgi:hypothetical protein
MASGGDDRLKSHILFTNFKMNKAAYHYFQLDCWKSNWTRSDEKLQLAKYGIFTVRFRSLFVIYVNFTLVYANPPQPTCDMRPIVGNDEMMDCYADYGIIAKLSGYMYAQCLLLAWKPCSSSHWIALYHDSLADERWSSSKVPSWDCG